jgi:hypothetical protein
MGDIRHIVVTRFEEKEEGPARADPSIIRSIPSARWYYPEDQTGTGSDGGEPVWIPPAALPRWPESDY